MLERQADYQQSHEVLLFANNVLDTISEYVSIYWIKVDNDICGRRENIYRLSCLIYDAFSVNSEAAKKSVHDCIRFAEFSLKNISIDKKADERLFLFASSMPDLAGLWKKIYSYTGQINQGFFKSKLVNKLSQVLNKNRPDFLSALPGELIDLIFSYLSANDFYAASCSSNKINNILRQQNSWKRNFLRDGFNDVNKSFHEIVKLNPLAGTVLYAVTYPVAVYSEYFREGGDEFRIDKYPVLSKDDIKKNFLANNIPASKDGNVIGLFATKRDAIQYAAECLKKKQNYWFESEWLYPVYRVQIDRSCRVENKKSHSPVLFNKAATHARLLSGEIDGPQKRGNQEYRRYRYDISLTSMVGK